jgi:transposase
MPTNYVNGNRKYIHPAQKELIVSMASFMSSADIAHVTHISQRTVQRVVSLWKRTGEVERKPLVRGRPREPSSGDVAVSESCFLVRASPLML